MSSLSEHLAEYALSLDFKDLPQDVTHEVKRRLIDSLACAFGAYNCKPGEAVRNIGKDISSIYGASLLGIDHQTSPELAAFSNGILIRYLDYNDTYLAKEPAHPSDNISAALAVAEAEKTDGKAFITAVVLGYEIQCRFCDGASLRSRGWDHAGYVVISTAILASRLMGLNNTQTENAIALAINPNIPLRQARIGKLSMWKGCSAANAAKGGVFAAVMAKNGVTGPAQIFEGEKGFFSQVTGNFDLDVENFGGRGGNFKILDTYIKYYPAEYHSQAAIEAALELRTSVNIDEIDEIYIESYDTCIDIIAGDDEKWHPKTRETADHSLPYIVAVALFDGTVSMKQFSEERIRDKALLSLIKKVKVKRNVEHNKAYPDSFPCYIEIKTSSGKTFSTTVSYPKGHPKNPLTDLEIVEKFDILSKNFLTVNQRKEILDSVWNIENIPNLNCFMKLFYKL